MATTRVSVSLNTHELAVVADALRVYSEVILADLQGTPVDVKFNDAVCNGNWHMGYITVEAIRAQMGSGEPPAPEVRAQPRPAQSMTRPRKKTSVATQARKANRNIKRISRFLGG